MRILVLVAAVWGLVGTPMLCRAGVLVECCAHRQHADEDPHGYPDDCCPGSPDEAADPCPEGSGQSDQRNCSSCAEVCNAAACSPAKGAAKYAEIGSAPVAVVAPAALGSEWARLSGTWPGDAQQWLRANLPFPASDRPLLL